jgi:two-component system phosphate regulon sensor histidine kinase PhoR
LKKNIFFSLVLFIIISIVSIILFQGYWLYTSWINKEEEFSLSVQQSLQSVAKDIQERELSDYISAYEKYIDSIGSPDNANFAEIYLFLDEDKANNIMSYYAYGILEENYNIAPYLEPKLSDSIQIKDYKSVRNTTIINKNDIFDRENNLTTSIEKIKTVNRINLYDQAKREAFIEYSKNLPIHKRLNFNELSFLIEQELLNKKIITLFEFGVYNKGLATKIKSNNYSEIQVGPKYSSPIFFDEKGIGQYELVVSFPKKSQYVLSSILPIAVLTIILTLFIVIASSISLYQMIQQKKISEIKTDFINNMSHEFKTPIATIGLALDAISNPKSISKPKKIQGYIKMIREENKRMLSQVESVLTISQLEKSKVLLKKSNINLHPIINDADNQIKLIINDRGGKINKVFNAKNDVFYGNKNHFTNLILNILDNSIKYSYDSPVIKIQTKSDNDLLVVTIMDKGIGMDFSTQKKIFEKFFREESGNVHNVKGHGLGLSYVKKIVDLHNGRINIESKKDAGTIFTVSIPLLN